MAVVTEERLTAGVEQKKTTRAPLIALGAVVLMFIALASVIAIKTPAYESADEPGHVQNIETIVSGHWYGVQGGCRPAPHVALVLSCHGDEAQQAPLYYLVMAGWQRVAGVPTHSIPALQLNPQIFLGRSVDFFTSHGSNRFLLWLRLPNVLLGALTVLLVFLAARQVTDDPWTPVVASACLAFLPRFVFLSSSVTNDNLVALLGAVLAYTALRFVRRRSPWWMAASGAAFGLLVATKLSTIPVGLAIVVLACLVATWRRRAELLAIGLGSAFVTGGWLLLQNTVRYGDPLASVATKRYLAGMDGLGVIGSYHVSDPVRLIVWQVPQRIVDTFWYQSGWEQYHWPGWVNLTITVAVIGCLAGLIRSKVSRSAVVVLAAIAIGGLLGIWADAFQTATYEGRIGYAGVAGVAVLVALGLERWRLAVRFILPTLGFIGVLVAIQQSL